MNLQPYLTKHTYLWNKAIFMVLLALPLWTASAQDKIAPAKRLQPAPPHLYFIEPRHGSVVAPQFEVKFGLSGMGVAPAGINYPNTGHHHLLVDLQKLPDMNRPLPSTPQIIHFGGGQTETKMALLPGTHYLQLLLGNYLHIPHKPPIMSKRIKIIVREKK